MPVTKSAKKALRTATRRHEENLLQKDAYKKAVKSVKKAVVAGSTELASLFSAAQSSLDKAAKNNTIHPNKAARLKSRLNKKMTTTSAIPVSAKRTTARKTTTKKASPKK